MVAIETVIGIMYYVSDMKQLRFIISPDSLSCPGNSFVGFMWPYLGSCICFEN